ncbi:adenine deaminase [Bacillus marasmi]|uniref:adenine deaminase n=1 Tax=Bacillus marasmi TaxID=1926279 RepID=UPI0011C75D8D|nr:adenine deaminase [Bacillus marasmi]
MALSNESIKKRINVAAKRVEADLVIKNGYVVDVFNQEILQADVAIVNGCIVGIGQYEGKTVIDAKNQYICPAFIDGHVHIESSMVTPSEFAKVVLPHGVTTIIADPHEIANVSGVEGIRFMLDTSDNLPLHVFFMLPSCVPATPFENAGAHLLADDLAPFYQHPRVLGLGEVMDYPSVLHGKQQMLDKISSAHHFGKKIDGHAAGLHNHAIDVYTSVGIKTDHEAVTASEAKERLQKGMYLIIRQGSVAKDLPNLISIVTERNARRCLFGTDDKHIDDLIEEGSIDHHVRLAIEYGIDSITAITMASLNAAECYGLVGKGAIAPGYDADILILDDLEKIKINKVFSGGKLVVETGKLTTEIVSKQTNMLGNSVRINQFSKRNLKIPLTNKTQANIIEIIPNSLVTKHVIEEVEVEDGYFIPSLQKDQLKMAVIERHKLTGNIGLGIVKGLRLKKGAIATTIAHDSHNLIVTGTNDDDIMFAIDSITNIGGGLIVVCDNQILAQLPLAIGGILSELDYKTVFQQLSKINQALISLGASNLFNPFLTLSFLALPVIPQLKLTDLGLFNVQTFQHIGIQAGN